MNAEVSYMSVENPERKTKAERFQGAYHDNLSQIKADMQGMPDMRHNYNSTHPEEEEEEEEEEVAGHKIHSQHLGSSAEQVKQINFERDAFHDVPVAPLPVQLARPGRVVLSIVVLAPLHVVVRPRYPVELPHVGH
jgi:hypothetical protein